MSEIDLEAIENARNVQCFQCGPEGLCRGCQELEMNYTAALKAEVERLRARVKQLEAKAEEDSYAKKDRERFLHKLAEIKMETGRLVGNSRGRRFDEGCKYAGLRIQKIIIETGELEK